MDFNLTAEEEAFRQEVRQFLADKLPPAEERGDGFIWEWWKSIREKRWIGFSWPTEVGGGGASIMQQFILKEELLKARAPLLGSDYTGIHWVGPAIIQFGSDEQKAEYIPEILDSKSIWCTGYSEPDVGSDLASLQCRAVRDGDEYVVNGQKIWTTLAHLARRIFLMVRTDTKGESKHDGISCLLVPMDTPGIDVRPIKAMTTGGMAHMLNEVFFTDVRVPEKFRLGAEGQGWEIVCSALQSERSGISEVNRHESALEDLTDLARRSQRGGKPAIEDGQVRQTLGSFEARIEAMRLNGMRALTSQLRGDLHPSQASINKLHNCDLLVEMSDLAMQLLGCSAPYVSGSDAVIDGGRWQNGALSWPATVVGGGTPNVQRNIIAERFLGLPKD